MKFLYALYNFAAEYNCGTYGSGNFNDSASCEAIVGDNLANTGADVYVGIGIGVVLIGLAIFLMLRSRKKNKK